MPDNLPFRRDLLTKANTPALRKALLEVCKHDILFWINCFGYQFNPDTREKGPFICRSDQEIVLLGGECEVSAGVRQYQYGLLECIQDRQPVRWLKSRYIGATWLLCFAAVWMCLFHENVKGLIMSKDEETAEDSDNPDSIFWKIQFILDHLPDWMTKGTGKKKKGVIKFWNGNTLTSTANVETAGVGGRATFMILDEFGLFKKGHDIYSLSDDISDCRIFVGTHKGRSTMLYTLAKDAKYADMREIVSHWSHDPEKRRGLYRVGTDGLGWKVLDNTYEYPHGFRFVTELKPSGGPFPFIRSPWYDRRCLNRSDYSIAMNLDIDPDGSSLTFFDGYRIEVLQRECREPLWRGRLDYDKDLGTPRRLIPDPKGLLKLWVNPIGDAELPRMRAGAGVDVGAGTGWTPSCLSAFNALTGDLVLHYEDANIFSVDFGALVPSILRMIKDEKGVHPLLSWEIQGGAEFAKRLMELCKYFHVYYRRDESIVGNPVDSKGRAGWNATEPAKLKMLEAYRDALYTQKIMNFDQYALDETLHFIYTGRGVTYKGVNHGHVKDAESGASVHHGDMPMADAQAYKMIVELGFERPKIADYSVTIPNPRTSGWREWLMNNQREEEEVWV